MPIQFCCTQCGQPIEVDDEHANRSAACPYCQHVVRVPEQSTFTPGGAVSARPLGGPPPPPRPPGTGADEAGSTPMIGQASGPQKAANAVRLGNLALVCSGTAIVLLLVVTVIALNTAAQFAGPATTQPNYGELTRALQESPGGKYLVVANLGMLLSAFVGAGLATASLAHTRDNWRGWTALAISGGMLVCICLASLLTLVLPQVAPG